MRKRFSYHADGSGKLSTELNSHLFSLIQQFGGPVYFLQVVFSLFVNHLLYANFCHRFLQIRTMYP